MRSNSNTYSGRCSCGEVIYSIFDIPIFTHACHCSLCQRYTASAFVVHSAIETNNFSLVSGKLIDTPGPSGSGSMHRVYRCNTCFDQIYSHYNFVENNGVLILKTTTLDNPNIFPPQAHIFLKNKLDWVKIDQDTPKFKGMYKREDVYSRESLKRRRLVE